jgi:hypothetical protein
MKLWDWTSHSAWILSTLTLVFCGFPNQMPSMTSDWATATYFQFHCSTVKVCYYRYGWLQKVQFIDCKNTLSTDMCCVVKLFSDSWMLLSYLLHYYSQFECPCLYLASFGTSLHCLATFSLPQVYIIKSRVVESKPLHMSDIVVHPYWHNISYLRTWEMK